MKKANKELIGKTLSADELHSVVGGEDPPCDWSDANMNAWCGDQGFDSNSNSGGGVTSCDGGGSAPCAY
jgi:hypothetical protein